MLGFALTTLLALAAGGVVASIMATAPYRSARRQAKLRGIKEVKVSRNHQDLFLLVLDLVTVHERGYLSIFPDEAALEQAKRLISNYREIQP